MEVWNKSYCRPIETLVDILQEHPTEVEHIFKPSCVLLMRCGGCCSDEGLECVPTEVHDVTMEVMKIKPHQGDHITQMNFVQHSKCICRPKKDRGEIEKSHCAPCSEKRKHLFIQDPESCKCSCKFTHLRCKSKRLELNERSCRVGTSKIRPWADTSACALGRRKQQSPHKVKIEERCEKPRR
ncbi:vascular endothelial growth factor Ab isoform X2 [Scyliorhinus canicula]|uniref:vascular endothelial growth factor Ab isoform X2 n=1 Tax=Scyliorhinus canicula TaxID=7830 RepID=UPI0018F4A739|nr:vascular endothelial growth factor Ab isoform X2 [Scyliorhinus canicula]